MLRALRAKFAIPQLKAALLATGTAKLVEVPGRSKDRWAGPDGLLGVLLMRVRQEIAIGEQQEQEQERKRANNSNSADSAWTGTTSVQAEVVSGE